MKRSNVFAVLIVALLATMDTLTAQEKYAVIIGGNVNPDESTIPISDQWNGGPDAFNNDFDEIWNDLYLTWEMLVFHKNYNDDNVHVLYGDSPAQDYTFSGQDDRYKAIYHQGYTEVTDEDASEASIQYVFEDELASAITAEDFLFVWIMGHGGSDATGHYFYSYDNEKIYASDLAGWLDGISAHRKVIYLSFPKSGGFAPVLENAGNVVITACGGASRTDVWEEVIF